MGFGRYVKHMLILEALTIDLVKTMVNGRM